jgi:Zn-dependent protease with chaperone function
MITLFILAAIGALAGATGGALTNGLDGFVLGGSAGFVLGVVAWVTENMAVHRAQELQADHLGDEFNRTNPPLYDHPSSRSQPYNERGRSP